MPQVYVEDPPTYPELHVATHGLPLKCVLALLREQFAEACESRFCMAGPQSTAVSIRIREILMASPPKAGTYAGR